MPDAQPLLDGRFMAQLERLQLATQKVITGRVKGERRSTRKGQSVEFADYRDYSRGDDLRHLDWNLYARFDRMFIKLFQEEQDLQFTVLVDTSASMGFGDPPKLDYAKKVAAALAYVGLSGSDRVVVAAIGDTLRDFMPPARGKPAMWRMFRFLEGLQAQGQTSLADACRAFAIRQKRRGVVVLISDFMDPRGYEDALRLFLARKDDLYVVHVLSEDELQPTLSGHLKLVDAETGAFTEITASPALLEIYRETVRAYCGAIRGWCAKRDIQYLSASTQLEFDRLVLDYLRRAGLVK